MRLLFAMDQQDHEHCTHEYTRHSARAIIIREGKVAMIHSLAFDYYKFPGGGIELGEDPVDAMIRETHEEAGLIVIPETIREYGYVHRVQCSTSDKTERFIQDNFYYLCDVEDQAVSQQLDAYEAEAAFTLEYVDPVRAIHQNRTAHVDSYEQLMIEREARMLEMLIADGLLVPHDL